MMHEMEEDVTLEIKIDTDKLNEFHEEVNKLNFCESLGAKPKEFLKDESGEKIEEGRQQILAVSMLIEETIKDFGKAMQELSQVMGRADGELKELFDKQLEIKSLQRYKEEQETEELASIVFPKQADQARNHALKYDLLQRLP